MEVADFLDLRPPRGVQPGLVVLNPPYGQRVHADDLENLYGGIGALKHRWTGWRAALLFPKDLEAQHRIGLKPSAKHTVMNGPLACTWAIYDLFKGKRAEHLSGATAEGAQGSGDRPDAAPVTVAVEAEGESVRFGRPRFQQPRDEAAGE